MVKKRVESSPEQVMNDLWKNVQKLWTSHKQVIKSQEQDVKKLWNFFEQVMNMNKSKTTHE